MISIELGYAKRWGMDGAGDGPKRIDMTELGLAGCFSTNPSPFKGDQEEERSGAPRLTHGIFALSTAGTVKGLEPYSYSLISRYLSLRLEYRSRMQVDGARWRRNPANFIRDLLQVIGWR